MVTIVCKSGHLPVYGINLDISVVLSLSRTLINVESTSMYLSSIIFIFFPLDFFWIQIGLERKPPVSSSKSFFRLSLT